MNKINLVRIMKKVNGLGGTITSSSRNRYKYQNCNQSGQKPGRLRDRHSESFEPGRKAEGPLGSMLFPLAMQYVKSSSSLVAT